MTPNVFRAAPARHLALWLVGGVVLVWGTLASAGAGATNIAGVDEFIDAPRALFGTTRSEIEARLGSPLAVGERRAAHPRDPAAVRRVEDLRYPGVTLRVSTSAVLLRVQITEAQYRLPHGLGVGTSRRDIERILGEPQLVTDTRVLYLYSDGYPDTVEFHFHGDRVSRIEWNYWVE